MDRERAEPRTGTATTNRQPTGLSKSKTAPRICVSTCHNLKDGDGRLCADTELSVPLLMLGGCEDTQVEGKQVTGRAALET